jgi:hypothetical protein
VRRSGVHHRRVLRGIAWRRRGVVGGPPIVFDVARVVPDDELAPERPGHQDQERGNRVRATHHVPATPVGTKRKLTGGALATARSCDDDVSKR